jgi:lipoate-protein ligase A
MRAQGGAILQHGAILVDWDGCLQAGAMGLADDASLRPQVTTLRDELGRELPRAVLEEALVEAFRSELGVEFETEQPNDAERAHEQQLIGSFVVGG